MGNFVQEVLGDMPRIILSGSAEAALDGISGIYTLTDSEIGFRCGGGRVIITGENLRILSVFDSRASVGGKIYAVSLDKISGGNKNL